MLCFVGVLVQLVQPFYVINDQSSGYLRAGSVDKKEMGGVGREMGGGGGVENKARRSKEVIQSLSHTPDFNNLYCIVWQYGSAHNHTTM